MNKFFRYFIGVFLIAGMLGQHVRADEAGAVVPAASWKDTAFGYMRKSADFAQDAWGVTKKASTAVLGSTGRLLGSLYEGKKNEVSIMEGAVQAGIGSYIGYRVGEGVCSQIGITSATNPVATEVIEKGAMLGGGIASLIAHDAGYNICNHPYWFIALMIIGGYGDRAFEKIKHAMTNNKITTATLAAGALAYSYAQGLDLRVFGNNLVERFAINPAQGLIDAFTQGPWKSTAILAGAVLGKVLYKKYFLEVQNRYVQEVYDAVVAGDRLKAYNNAQKLRNYFGFKTDYYIAALNCYYGLNNTARTISLEHLKGVLWGAQSL